MIYFDNAATSFPKPPLVPEAVLKCLTGYAANPGRSGHDLALQAGREIFEVREKIAGFFNIKDSMQIVFTSNATDALNMGLHGFLSAGDRVLTTSMEHNSVLRPLTALSQKGVIHEIIWGNQQGQIDLETLAKALQAGYKLFVVNHASNVCGSVAPLQEIGRLCREAGVTLMVDGSQSA